MDAAGIRSRLDARSTGTAAVGAAGCVSPLQCLAWAVLLAAASRGQDTLVQLHGQTCDV